MVDAPRLVLEALTGDSACWANENPPGATLDTPEEAGVTADAPAVGFPNEKIAGTADREAVDPRPKPNPPAAGTGVNAAAGAPKLKVVAEEVVAVDETPKLNF